LTEKEITEALKNGCWYARMAAILNSNVTPEHISIALKDEASWVRWLAIESPNVTLENILVALRDEYWQVRYAAIDAIEDIVRSDGAIDDVVRSDDVVCSDEHTDSCLDKRLIKIEARQKFMLGVMYMALSSIVFGIGTWIFKSLF